MARHHVHTVFVMHPPQGNSGEPYVWGIVSDLDLMHALGGDGTDTAGSLAHVPVVSVKPPMPLCDAGALMLKHGVSHLVVIDTETRRPIGVLSTTDITDALAWGAP
jgi:CBS domain-containing protein